MNQSTHRNSRFMLIRVRDLRLAGSGTTHFISMFYRPSTLIAQTTFFRARIFKKAVFQGSAISSQLTRMLTDSDVEPSFLLFYWIKELTIQWSTTSSVDELTESCNATNVIQPVARSKTWGYISDNGVRIDANRTLANLKIRIYKTLLNMPLLESSSATIGVRTASTWFPKMNPIEIFMRVAVDFDML